MALNFSMGTDRCEDLVAGDNISYQTVTVRRRISSLFIVLYMSGANPETVVKGSDVLAMGKPVNPTASPARHRPTYDQIDSKLCKPHLKVPEGELPCKKEACAIHPK